MWNKQLHNNICPKNTFETDLNHLLHFYTEFFHGQMERIKKKYNLVNVIKHERLNDVLLKCVKKYQHKSSGFKYTSGKGTIDLKY